MYFALLLLFTIVPFIELYLLLVIGARIGALTTIMIVILTGIVGASLARIQGFKVLRDIQLATQAGQMPGTELIHGALVLIGGLLLLTPGFLTDLFGFSLLFPPSRKIYVNRMIQYFLRKTKSPSISVDFQDL